MTDKRRVIWLTLSTALGKGAVGVGGERIVFASNLMDCKGYLKHCHLLAILKVDHVAYSR